MFTSRAPRDPAQSITDIDPQPNKRIVLSADTLIKLGVVAVLCGAFLIELAVAYSILKS